MSRKFIWIILMGLCTSLVARAQISESLPKAIEQMKEVPVYTSFPFGAIKPVGWLKTQMQADLNGFVGNLDKLVPDLINDPIYGSGRLHKNSKAKDLGNNKEGDAEGDEQYKWWNSESQSNWWDGYLRNALLLNDVKHIARVKKYISDILSTQDADGYLGIYASDLRYHFTSENGELWAKATLYRGLLAYYEYTNDPQIWNALVRAVDNVMTNYPVDASHPFDTGMNYNGGVGHGLTFTDVLDRMYQLTGEEKYLDYALFLYLDYSKFYAWERDAQLTNALNKEYKLNCHAVHTYEHLRPMIVAASTSEDAKIKKALMEYLRKINTVTTATGGAIGDEWIGGREADATHTGYEYCSLHELLDSYGVLLQRTGDTALAESIENIFYNAAQGARHPYHSCIAYLKTDNSYQMDGTRNGDAEPGKTQTRYKYSPVHQDVAVCCAPNAGRITPYFLQNAWMQGKNHILIANLLMPCMLDTRIDGNRVCIENQTGYPLKNEYKFVITLERPMDLTLKIRRPQWAEGVICSESYKEEGQYLVFKRNFNSKDQVRLSFKTNVRVVKGIKGEHYLFYGIQAFAYPLKFIEEKGRQYIDGFTDYLYKPVENTRYKYIENHRSIYRNGKLEAFLLNEVTGKEEKVELLPISQTILRQAGF